MEKAEQIGFHKGSLTTLAKERQELLRMVAITEQLIQAHLKALKDLGVDLEAEQKKLEEQNKLEKKICYCSARYRKPLSIEIVIVYDF